MSDLRPTTNRHVLRRTARGVRGGYRAPAGCGIGATAGGPSCSPVPFPRPAKRCPSSASALGRRSTSPADRPRSAQRREVLDILFAAGGRMIDSSPMYGRSEAVVGTLLAEMGARDKAFLATKVWTAAKRPASRRCSVGGADAAPDDRPDADPQSRRLANALEDAAGVEREGHVPHYRHHALHDVGLRRADGDHACRKGIDFVQMPYSLAVREAEAKLLPLAQERGIAVIPNRPFDGANMFAKVKGRPLPGGRPTSTPRAAPRSSSST